MPTIDLSGANVYELQTQCYRTAFEHGFHPVDEHVDIDQKLLLAVGELVEAQNELRTGHGPLEVYFDSKDPEKPEGFGIELADAVIRILDLGHVCGLDMQLLIERKMNYNETRPYKHGKQF